MSKPIGLMEVKQALRDKRFRDALPEDDFADDLRKYLQNPGCACNVPIYRKVLKQKTCLAEYYPGRELSDPDKELQKLAENNWLVINCKADELEQKLHDLPPGRKQLAVARFEDEVTVVVNELDVIY